MVVIGIKFPFKETTSGGIIEGTITTLEQVRSNLIALLTTRRRQRVMRNSYYSPLYDYLFEAWDDIAEQQLREELYAKIQEFIPEVTVRQIILIFDETTYVLQVQIVYTVIELFDAQDTVSIEVNLQNNI
jgi:phage baseplate assembly protein W